MPHPKLPAGLRFLAVFGVLYLAFILPWPGWRDAYARGFCSFARRTLPENSGLRILRFDFVPPGHRNRALDTRVTVANRAQLDAAGSGPAVMLDLDSRGIGYLPSALITALVLATPLPWGKRLLRLLAGLAAVHALILLTLLAGVWDTCLEAEQLDLLHLTPFWQSVVRGLDETLVVQLGASFVVPFVCWVVLCYGSESLAWLRNRTAQATGNLR